MVDGVCGLYRLVISNFLGVTPPRTINVSGSNNVSVVALFLLPPVFFCFVLFLVNKNNDEIHELVLHWVPHRGREGYM